MGLAVFEGLVTLQHGLEHAGGIIEACNLIFQLSARMFSTVSLRETAIPSLLEHFPGWGIHHLPKDTFQSLLGTG